jgi:hypothetical protein
MYFNRQNEIKKAKKKMIAHLICFCLVGIVLYFAIRGI